MSPGEAWERFWGRGEGDGISHLDHFKGGREEPGGGEGGEGGAGRCGPGVWKSIQSNLVSPSPSTPSPLTPAPSLPLLRFVGRLVGKALHDGQLIDAYFTRSFYKHMLGMPLTYEDIEGVDPEYYKNLIWMLGNDITDVLDLTFSAESDFFGRKEVVELVLGERGRGEGVLVPSHHRARGLFVWVLGRGCGVCAQAKSPPRLPSTAIHGSQLFSPLPSLCRRQGHHPPLLPPPPPGSTNLTHCPLTPPPPSLQAARTSA